MATIRLMRDFKEFLQLLDSEKIEYLLIGGYAVALYGYVRPTKDMDIWVAGDAASQQRLADALIHFGFPASTLKQPLFTDEKTVLRMGVPPNRLEVLSQIAGVDFRECYAKRRMLDVDGMKVAVIGYDELLLNKRSTGRASDRADVERLEKRNEQP
jgi:hypothetical protein